MIEMNICLQNHYVKLTTLLTWCVEVSEKQKYERGKDHIVVAPKQKKGSHLTSINLNQ